jgi:hypothetical protein
MEHSSLPDLLKHLARASSVLDISECKQADKGAEVLWAYLEGEAKAFVQRHSQMPVLFSYSSDATSLLCVAVSVARHGDSQVLRKGRVLHEMLLQRGVFVCQGSSSREVTHLVAPPRSLDRGKSVWHHFVACTEFASTLRAQGHSGIVVNHYAFDRAVYEPLFQKLVARHEGYYDDAEAWSHDIPIELGRLLDWTVGTACSLHDCHNALKWSTKAFVDDAGVKDLHVVCESLRNSLSLLTARLPKFLASVVDFRREPVDEVTVRCLWQALGVEADWLDEFVHVHPVWRNGHLLVNAQCAEETDFLQRLTTIVLHVFKFRRFADSRWLSTGPCCLSLCKSLLCGLTGLVDVTRRDPTCTDFHLHGFCRLVPGLKVYVVVNAMCSQVADSVLQELLEDDRLAARVTALKEVMAVSLQWLSGLPSEVWNILAQLTDGESTGVDVHSYCLQAAHIQAAFMDHRFFEPASRLPWSLCQGDVQANLRALQGDPQGIADHTARKIAKLLALGFNTELLEQGIRLFREVSWSTVAVEQGHGSCAVLKRQHQECSGRTIAARAMLHQCRHFFNPDARLAHVNKLSQRLAVVARQKPQRVSGRSLLLAELNRAADRSSFDGSASNALRKNLVRQLSTVWHGLSPVLRDHLERVAVAQGKNRQAEVETGLRDLRVQLHLEQERLAQEVSAGAYVAHRLSFSRFGEQHFARLSVLWASEEFTSARVAKLRDKSWAPPGLPTAAEQEFFAVRARRMFPGEFRTIEPWVREVAKNRELFANTVLMPTLQEPGGVAHAFIYATKKPLSVTLLEVVPREVVQPDASGFSMEDILGWSQHTYKYEFKANAGAYVRDDHLPWSGIDDLCVVPDVVFLGEHRLVSSSSACPLRIFVERYGQLSADKAETEGPRIKRGRPAPSQELIDLHPWLEDFLSMPKDTHPSASASGSSARAGGASSSTHIADIPEEVMEEALSTLEAQRALLEQGEALGVHAFYVSVRGGTWTRHNRGRAYDAISGQARGGTPKQFCRAYGLNVMVSFATDLYGEVAASILARAWCHRMEYFYLIWLHQELWDYHFTETDCSGHVATEEWVDFFLGLDLLSVTMDRASALNRMRPGLPDWPA